MPHKNFYKLVKNKKKKKHRYCNSRSNSDSDYEDEPHKQPIIFTNKKKYKQNQNQNLKLWKKSITADNRPQIDPGIIVIRTSENVPIHIDPYTFAQMQPIRLRTYDCNDLRTINEETFYKNLISYPAKSFKN
jgi:hypothetical protein